MPETSPNDRFENLMALARDRADGSRRILLENMTDLFLSTEGRLSERERSLMSEILSRLLHEVEMEVRRDLADRLLNSDLAPRELLLKLSNDRVEVAAPLLMRSRLLHDEDLIEVIKHRSQEHRLAIAMRQELSPLVTQALIEFGDESVVETLLGNHDVALSREALEYLVDESKRLDRFQEPLLRRPDLPADLAHRMFWWVSAGLRQAILSAYRIDESLLDSLLEKSAAAVASQGQEADGGQAAILVRRMRERGELSERFVLQNLRSGHISAAIAGLAGLSGVDMLTARRVVLDAGGEALAVCCKVAQFTRGGFAAAYLLTREAHERQKVTDPAAVEAIVRLYDRLQPDQARAALRFWMRDSGYLAAVAALRTGQESRDRETARQP